MKEWKCVQVGDHKTVGKVIEELQEKGWRVHTYACAGIGAMMAVNHYLLFEKGE
ncbi:MAG: hypothetical protein P8X87_07525 [Candidatus Bathyarchaeota archaeon]